jgi:hypothetical protein
MEPEPTVLHADEVHVPERLIVAPAGGVFREIPTTGADGPVEVGQAIGEIVRPTDEVAVVSPHTGRLMGLLVLSGERVRARQPIAWVRAAG